jgi:hypothetical protein
MQHIRQVRGLAKQAKRLDRSFGFGTAFLGTCCHVRIVQVFGASGHSQRGVDALKFGFDSAQREET